MDFLSSLVQQVVTIMYNFTAMAGVPNYGLAIIIMTIIVKVILYPLTAKQIASTTAMMELQPKMKAVQERYKNDKVLLNQKMAEMYCDEVKPYFDVIRLHCDKLELLVDNEIWTMTKYRELLFTR